MRAHVHLLARPVVSVASSIELLEPRRLLAITLSGPTYFETAASPTTVATADFNGDGRLDLAVTSSLNTTPVISILLGNGNGTFGAKTDVNVASFPYGVLARDFDNDGKIDLVTGHQNENNIGFLKGNGNGTFVARVTSSTGPNTFPTTTHTAAADFNNDGLLDVAVNQGPDQDVVLMKNNGNGTFTRQGSVNVSAANGEILTGDFNNDQKQDVAYTNGATSGVIVHLGDGNFGLGSPNFYAIGSDQIAGLAAADFDGDGSLDIAGVTSDLGASEQLGVLINNGNGTFQAADLYPAGESPGTIGAADLSGDGKPDIYVQSTVANATSLVTFQNNGDGTFAAFTPIGAPDSTAAGGGGQESATGDFNGDGSPDIAYVAVVGVQHAPTTGGAALIYLSPPAPAGILGPDNILRITGGDAIDVIAITRSGGNVRVSKNGIVTNFPFASVVSIDVRPAGGHDVVTLGPNIRTTFVDAGTGNDRVLADAALTANVAVTGAGGNDTIVGGGGNDELSGANGKDRILGQGGNDYLLGGASNDYLLGGAGNDICSGAGGKDRVFGDGGNDYLLGGNGNDLLDAVVLIDGVEGIDTVSGNAGIDTGVVRLDDIVAGVENLTTV